MARKKKGEGPSGQNGRPPGLAKRMDLPYTLSDHGDMAGDIAPEKTKWLVDPWVAKGALTLVAGAPNAGKSTFGAWLMGKAKYTLVLPGHEESVGAMTVPRMKAHDVPLGQVFVVTKGEWTFPHYKERLKWL